MLNDDFCEMHGEKERQRESSRAEAGRDRQCLYERETERVQQSRSRGETDSVCMRERQRESSRAEAGERQTVSV